MRGHHQILDQFGDLQREMAAVHLQSLSGQISIYCYELRLSPIYTPGGSYYCWIIPKYSLHLSIIK